MNLRQLNEVFDKLGKQFLNENLDRMKDMVEDDSIDSYDLYDELITYTNDMWANGIDTLIQDTGDKDIELDGQGDTTMLSASAGYVTWSSDDELQLLVDLVLEADSDSDVEKGILEFLKNKYNKLAQNRNTDESLHKPLEENEGKKYNPQPRPAFPGRDLGSLLQNAIADAVQDYYDTTGVIPTRQEVRNAIEPFIQSLSSYEELQENESLDSINEGTNFKRVARYGEFDNGYVMHNWAKMSDKEAENKAKQMSIKNPDDIYYVAYDDIMDPSSDIRWIAGEPYNYSDVQIKNGKPFIKGVMENLVKSTKNTKVKEDWNKELSIKGFYDMFVPHLDPDTKKKAANLLYDWYSAEGEQYMPTRSDVLDMCDAADDESEKELVLYALGEIGEDGNFQESLNEEESPKSISDTDNNYPLAFVPTDDVKGKDFTNVLCDILNKAGIKNCCAKKRGGNYHITVICPSGKLATAKTIIENCGFFKKWLSLNNEDKNESLKEERGDYGHKGPFWYYSKHGMGPGTIPKDVKVVDWYEDDNYNTWIALDGVLTTQELREYELKEQKPPIKDR